MFVCDGHVFMVTASWDDAFTSGVTKFVDARLYAGEHRLHGKQATVNSAQQKHVRGEKQKEGLTSI